MGVKAARGELARGLLRPLCRVAAASGEMEGPGLGSQVSAAGRGQSWGGESGGGGRREREGVGVRRLPGGASGERRGLGWGGGSMETPRMMLGIFSETTGKKRRGRAGGVPYGPSILLGGPGRPLGPVLPCLAGTAEGPGKGVWPFLGEVSGDTPERDQPVLTLAWNPCGSLDFFLRRSCLDTCLGPTQPSSGSCSHILAYSFKEPRLLV